MPALALLLPHSQTLDLGRFVGPMACQHGVHGASAVCTSKATYIFNVVNLSFRTINRTCTLNKYTDHLANGSRRWGAVHWDHGAPLSDLRVEADLIEFALEIVTVEARLLRGLKGRGVGNGAWS